ncbi:hypothetical protein FO519_008677 [Halicephalobus sp. NKZ332]|nr:hypothetical protein FO519_008677 [Halicephalobus sp. NKZ332]
MHESGALSLPFEHFYPRFRSCWGSLHVKHGVLVIGIVQLILTVFFCVAFLFETETYSVWDVFEICTLLGEVLVLILLFVGLRTRIRLFLIPYIIYQGLCTLFLIFVIVWGFFVFVEPQGKIGNFILRILIEISGPETPGEQRSDDLLFQFPVWFLILFCLILSVISAWCVSVVYRCYDYFKQLSQIQVNGDKITLLLFLFPFTIFVGIFALLVWARLGSDLLVIIIFVVVMLQLLFSVFSVPVFFDEKKYKSLFPLMLIHALTLVIYVILAFIYIVLFIISKSSDNGSRVSNRTTSPDLPRTGLDDTGVEEVPSAEYSWRGLGHALFLLPIQLFLTYICYGVYIIFRSRNNPMKKSPKAYYVSSQGERQADRNIIILEQQADNTTDGSNQQGQNEIP